jgi:probable HAF family extracellular repeat protein
MLNLGDLTGGFGTSGANAINDAGQVVGWSDTYNSGDEEAFLWDPQFGMIGLGDLPGSFFDSWATGINNRGQVTGHSYSSDPTGQMKHVEQAFLWDAETGMVGLGDLPGGQFISIPFDINDSTQIVGWSCSYFGCEPFLWDPVEGWKGLGDLVPGPNSAGTAYAINNLSQVVGGCASTKGYLTEAFLWDPVNGMIGLGVFPGYESWTRANDLNDRGQVVGVASVNCPYCDDFPFIWDAEHGLRDLRKLLAAKKPAAAKWLGEPTGINNSGQICTRVYKEAMLLTPFTLGDMNCDGSANIADISGFIEALSDMAGYLKAHPDCWLGEFAADVNQDGSVNLADIEAFVGLLSP